MRPETRQRLLDLSARFYETHGATFDSTRGHAWPGWERVWDLVEPLTSSDRQLHCFDAGCGNGRFGQFLHERHRKLRFVGIDLDEGLLEAARRELSHLENAELLRHDLLESLDDVVAEASQDLVTLFGVLHHVPDESRRRDLLRRLASRVAPGGILVSSVWRLDRDAERFARKTVPWSEWNGPRRPDERIDPSDLDEGDALLSWRGDRSTPRYCHFPTDVEIERLAVLGPEMELVERIEADGPTGRDNLYLVWRRRDPAPVPCYPPDP